jgi:hypothetical protein
MLLPEASSTRSPGTSRAASMFCHLPSRLQVAVGLRDALRAATASAAFTVSYLGFEGWEWGVGARGVGHEGAPGRGRLGWEQGAWEPAGGERGAVPLAAACPTIRGRR